MKKGGLTRDSIIWNDLTVYQKRNGYRFSLDSVILARLTSFNPDSSVLEIGSGGGVVSLLLARCNGAGKITGVEIQKSLFELGLKNLKCNNTGEKIEFINCDIRDFKDRAGKRFDIIVSNPPFYAKGSGRINKNEEDTLSRHEINLTLNELIDSSKRLLAPKGRLYLIYKASRLAQMIGELSRHSIEAKLIVPIFSKIDSQADLVWIMALNNAGSGLKVLAPFICYGKRGKESQDLNAVYSKNDRYLRKKYPDLFFKSDKKCL